MKIPNYKLHIPKYKAGFTRTPKTWVSGFTVLESIVAIAVLSLSIAGVFSAIQQSFSQATIAKDEVKAFYLAQEAIEIIRNKRDANQLKNAAGITSSWLTDIAEDSTDPCYFNKICETDGFSKILVPCSGTPATLDSCDNLKQNTDPNDPNYAMYTYESGSSWKTTNFKRSIQIESVNADEIAITVQVSWTKGSLITRKFKAKAHLFKWI